MRFIKKGKVVLVEDASYVAKAGPQEGTKVQQVDVYIESDSPKYGPDRITGPLVDRETGEMILGGVAVGDHVEIDVSVTAASGRSGAYLRTFATACRELV